MEGEYLVKGVAADGPANVVAADGLPVIQPADILEAVDGRGIHTLVCVCVCCVCARACVRVCAIHTHTHTHIRILGGPSREPKLKQDAKPRSKHSGEDAIYGMGGLIRT